MAELQQDGVRLVVANVSVGGRKMRVAGKLAPLFALIGSLTLVGCGRKDLEFSHELKVFALAYHQFFAVRQVGPEKLEDLPIDQGAIPEVSRRIRDGTLVVIWKGQIQPGAENGAKFHLAYEIDIEKKRAWVLRSDGRPEKMSPEEFKELPPLPQSK